MPVLTRLSVLAHQELAKQEKEKNDLENLELTIQAKQQKIYEILSKTGLSTIQFEYPIKGKAGWFPGLCSPTMIHHYRLTHVPGGNGYNLEVLRPSHLIWVSVPYVSEEMNMILSYLLEQVGFGT